MKIEIWDGSAELLEDTLRFRMFELIEQAQSASDSKKHDQVDHYLATLWLMMDLHTEVGHRCSRRREGPQGGV